MSFFDNFSHAGGRTQSGLLGIVAAVIGGAHIGGLSGLKKLFDQKGRGDVMRSWVSTGRNKPISPNDVEYILGRERVRRIAADAGVTDEEATSVLSGVLPELVDQLTPDGKLPDDGVADDRLSELAGRVLKH
jgi:uncharacterized protein YidB (DUF937 family)